MWHSEAAGSVIYSRGIPRRDLLPPYLFVLCIERLSHLIHGYISEGKWKLLLKGWLSLSQSKSNYNLEKIVPFNFSFLPFYTHGLGVTYLMLIIVPLKRILSLSYVTHSFVH